MLPPVLPFQPQFNYPNNKLYQYEIYPILLSCNFVVDQSNGNGLGIRNLKGTGIANVFMGTTGPSSAPGNYGYISPNVSAGVIVVQFQNQFNRYLSGFSGCVSPLTGSPSAATTPDVPNVIVGLGTATLAQWHAVGFPAGMTPAIGAAFIPNGVGTIGGSAMVQLVGASGITSIEVCGDPNQTLQNSNLYQNGGAQILLQCLNGSTRTQPANGTVIGLNFYLSNSSVAVNGQ